MNEATNWPEVFRYTIAFVFLFAVIAKIWTFEQFRNNLSESFSVPVKLANPLAYFLITSETITVWFLLVPSSFQHLGMWLALSMLVIFTLILSIKFLTGELVRCNCFGDDDRAFSGWDLIRNVLLIVMSAFYLTFVQDTSASLILHLLFIAMSFLFSFLLINLHEIVAAFQYLNKRKRAWQRH